jgi:hypothetical protein
MLVWICYFEILEVGKNKIIKIRKVHRINLDDFKTVRLVLSPLSRINWPIYIYRYEYVNQRKYFPFTSCFNFRLFKFEEFIIKMYYKRKQFKTTILIMITKINVLYIYIIYIFIYYIYIIIFFWCKNHRPIKRNIHAKLNN